MTSPTLPKTADFIIIGAGIVGLCIAREVKKRHREAHVIIIEKEAHVGEHASGRNSGVLHAGFYYTPDSLKAKFTRDGNQLLTAYCLEKKIPLNRCGKLVVAQHEKDLLGLQELLKRGQQNKIALELISAKEAKEIEPRVKTFAHALFSPTTASVSPQIVLHTLLDDAKQAGIQVYFETQYLNLHSSCNSNSKPKCINKTNIIKTNRGTMEASYIINAAGLYADKVAKDFGFAGDYTILPFKGLYLYATANTEKLRTHIYPVPDLKNPFLGVHFTITVDGKIKIGPTAIPACWREHYQGLSRFNLKEAYDIFSRELGLFFRAGFDFRRLALGELKKYSRRLLAKQAGLLATNVHVRDYQTWGKPGIRAQLLNIKKRTLEMDFILESDEKSMHILNAVSPAFTCAMPFAKYVVDKIKKINYL